MHILFLPSYYPMPGNPILGSFFREQAHAIKRAQHQVGVIAVVHRSLKQIGKKTDFHLSNSVFEEDDGIPTYRFDEYNWLPLIPYGINQLCINAGLRLINRYIKEHGKPDIIHVHSALYAGSVAVEIKKRYGIPFVLTEHSSSFAQRTIRSWQASLVKSIFSTADARIVVSPALGRALEQFVGPEVRPWVWIPNIVDPIFQINEAKDRITSNYFRFLNVSLLTEIKGHTDLLHAFAARFRGQRDIQLRLGGDGPLLSKLVRLSEELGIGDQVIFLGLLSREKVVEEMQQANVFVLPSHYETFSVVLIEALTCGLPVVATACGGPEYIVNDSNGLLIQPKDPTALGNALVHMHENFASFDSHKIHDDCIRRFGEQAVVEQLIKVYENIVTK